MYKTFFKYVLQSIAGMLGLSVYILADTFFISVCSGSDGLAVLNLMRQDTASATPRRRRQITTSSSRLPGVYCSVFLSFLAVCSIRKRFSGFWERMPDLQSWDGPICASS